MNVRNAAIVTSLIVFVSLLAVPCLAKERETTGASTLTVEQTLAAVQVRAIEGTPFSVYKRGNPAAIPLLVRMLMEPQWEPHHAAMVYVIGYVGGEADVKTLLGRLAAYKGVLTPPQRDTVKAVCQALGLMASRGIVPAQQQVDQMTTEGFWVRQPFRARSDDLLEKKPGLRYQPVMWGLVGYGLWKRDLLATKTEAILRNAGNGEYLQWLLGRAGKVVDSIRKSEAQPFAHPIPTGASTPKTEANRGQTPSTPLPNEDAAWLRKTVDEAQAAFDVIAERILTAPNSTEVAERLLDNEKPIDKRRLQSRASEFARDLAKEAKILRLVRQGKTSAADFKVKRHLFFRIPRMADKEQLAGEQAEEITVRYKLTGTSEIGRGQLPHNVGTQTVGQDGSLIVVMKKINGKWYWNPFGW